MDKYPCPRSFTEGDTAEIVVHNQLKEATSLHWHGVFLPNKEDGIPYLTKCQLNCTSYTLSFPLFRTAHIGISHSAAGANSMYGALS